MRDMPRLIHICRISIRRFCVYGDGNNTDTVVVYERNGST